MSATAAASATGSTGKLTSEIIETPSFGAIWDRVVDFTEAAGARGQKAIALWDLDGNTVTFERPELREMNIDAFKRQLEAEEVEFTKADFYSYEAAGLSRLVEPGTGDKIVQLRDSEHVSSCLAFTARRPGKRCKGMQTGLELTNAELASVGVEFSKDFAKGAQDFQIVGLSQAMMRKNGWTAQGRNDPDDTDFDKFYEAGKPTFDAENGIIMTSGTNKGKGPSFEGFWHCASRHKLMGTPDVDSVVFFDNRIANVESMQEACTRLGLNFLGIHFTGDLALPDNEIKDWGPAIADFQKWQAQQSSAASGETQ